MKKKIGWVLGFAVITAVLVMLGCYNASRHHKFDKPQKATPSEVKRMAAANKPPVFMLGTNQLHFVGQLSATFPALGTGKKQ